MLANMQDIAIDDQVHATVTMVIRAPPVKNAIRRTTALVNCVTKKCDVQMIVRMLERVIISLVDAHAIVHV